MTNNRSKSKKDKSFDKSIEKDISPDKSLDKSIAKTEGNKSVDKSVEKKKGDKSVDESMEKNKENKSIDKSVEKENNKNILKDLVEDNKESENKSEQTKKSSLKINQNKIKKNKAIKNATKEAKNDEIGISWIFEKTILISIIRAILSPLLIYGIGKILSLIPDFSPILEIIFEQFGIIEEHIPIFLLLLNGIVVLFLNGIVTSFNFLKPYIEKTYGKQGKDEGNKFIERARNLSSISLINFVLFTIGVIGTLISPQANISKVAQLSVLYMILLIPYSILVMMDLHHYLPLPQGALLYIYVYGFLSLKSFNQQKFFEKLIKLPSTIKEIRQNAIRY
ncbi:hypothetical protein BCR32DRAFT_288767 [Anaeromyces robustus]|uniref:Uncharacterized protein n=1 Tax=Anaeromyces robustus TaxID=1754192 RepID=A0A1Y1XR64_9FUNG|nr:hypothetical protein BCR32DRAFT_288767 [Anaeromyces robustus]|eukprot:ORX88261.1 hypothetical protein BCR32DRAFT_288767 [Anaeromyces robustus]